MAICYELNCVVGVDMFSVAYCTVKDTDTELVVKGVNDHRPCVHETNARFSDRVCLRPGQGALFGHRWRVYN